MAETRPSFRFYAKDWLASTRGLSGAARGYHIDMLALAWLNDGCDIDSETLRRSVGAERSEWRRVWPELAPRWQEVNGRLVNRRLEEVREETNAYTEARRAAGKKGGTAKAEGKQTSSKPLANDVANTYPSFAFAVSSNDDTSASSPTNGQLRHAALDLLELWRQHGTGAQTPAFDKLDAKLKRAMWEALKTRSLAEWETVFTRAKASDYLAGRGSEPKPMSLSLVLASAGAIEAGEYDNRTVKPAPAAGPTSVILDEAYRNARYPMDEPRRA